MNWADYNLLRVALAPVFAIICHMATVLWVQTEMCDGSLHSDCTVFHLHSPLAHFHYPQGIQEVMASRARDSAGHFNFFAQTFSVIAQELRESVLGGRDRILEQFARLTVAPFLHRCPSFKTVLLKLFGSTMKTRSFTQTFESFCSKGCTGFT